MGKVLTCLPGTFDLFLIFYNQPHTKLFADVRIIDEGATLKLLVAMRYSIVATVIMRQRLVFWSSS
jgi:hypothetical protein